MFLAFSVLLAACGTAPDADSSSPPTSTNESRGTQGGGDEPAAESAGSACADLRATSDGTVELDSLIETSGLAASQVHDGVVWAHNDSGQETALHAIGPNGSDLGTFTLNTSADVAGVDIEDIAVSGSTVYLADIGDNDATRDEILIYRFPEPDPTAGGGAVADVEVVRLRYPDGPRDAEAFVVDPVTGELIIVEKAFGFGSGGGLVSPTPATIYTASPPFDSSGFDGTPIELAPTGAVAMDQLATQATAEPPADAIFTRLGVEGVATAADIRADGQLIAVRTYATVWLFERRDGQTVAEALASAPCEAPTIVEAQGEAVAFLNADSSAFVTVSEGTNPAWNVTAPTS